MNEIGTNTENAKVDERHFAGDRGDVPGWVLITLMTAAMVVLLWTVAAPALTSVFDQAMNKVASF